MQMALLDCSLVALSPPPSGYVFAMVLQKYISVDATKPIQLSVKQDGAVDVFEMQVSTFYWLQCWSKAICCSAVPHVPGITLNYIVVCIVRALQRHRQTVSCTLS